MTTKEPAAVGKHGYDGKCAPDGSEYNYPWKTFSVGVFEWLPMAKGKSLKKGKVKVRVAGRTNEAERVYKRANTIVDMLDRGEYNGPKTVNVIPLE